MTRGVLTAMPGKVASPVSLMTRLMQSVLFGVEPLDPVSFAVAPVVLMGIAIVACLLPALRAASTDAADALRCE